MGLKTTACALSSAATIGAFVWSCGPGGSGGAGGSGGLGGTGGAPVVTTIHPDAPPLPGESICEVVITTNLPNFGQQHVTPCTPVDYATNPPSSGNHWPIWAAYKKYDGVVVPRQMYVHDMEHGAVILLHRCAAADMGCAEVIAALGAAFDGTTSDSICTGVNARVILTQDPLLDKPIAMSAWGATYTATCIDPPSLAAFVAAQYGKGPEATCAAGKDVADPLFDPCPDAGTGGGGGAAGSGGAGGSTGGSGGGGG